MEGERYILSVVHSDISIMTLIIYFFGMIIEISIWIASSEPIQSPYMYEGPIKYFITHRLSCLETCPEGLSSKGKAIRWVMKTKRYLVNSRIYMILQKPYRGILASIETESNVQQQCYSIFERSPKEIMEAGSNLYSSELRYFVQTLPLPM